MINNKANNGRNFQSKNFDRNSRQDRQQGYVFIISPSIEFVKDLAYLVYDFAFVYFLADLSPRIIICKMEKENSRILMDAGQKVREGFFLVTVMHFLGSPILLLNINIV